jgi:8-oxo-dGTP pyrophosphatase MutT (NUDIX family)
MNHHFNLSDNPFKKIKDSIEFTQLELWDAYDKEMNKISDMILVRGEVVPDGIYHLVSEIIVKHIDGTYLIMQRDLKKHFGGMWELTAGGSALQGETPLECAIRELREETGIVVSSLKEIGKVVHDEHHSIYFEYLCITNCNKDSIKLQEGETINYRWIDKNNLLKMSENELASKRTIRLVKDLNI